MPSAFQDVPALSDDEGCDLVTPARVPSKRQHASTEKVSPCLTRRTLWQCKVPSEQKQRESSTNHLGSSGLVGRTRAIVQSKCRCSRNRRLDRNCFEPFRESRVFDLLIERLRSLAKMDKMEIDKEVGWTGSLGFNVSQCYHCSFPT